MNRVELLEKRLARLERIVYSESFKNRRSNQQNCNEIFGLSKAEKLDKINKIYHDLIANDKEKKFSAKYYDVYDAMGESNWKKFKTLASAVEKLKIPECTVELVSDGEYKSASEDFLKRYEEGDAKEFSKVKKLEFYEGPYIVDKESRNGRSLKFMLGKEPIGDIYIDFVAAKDWTESTFGKKLSELISGLKDSGPFVLASASA